MTEHRKLPTPAFRRRSHLGDLLCRCTIFLVPGRLCKRQLLAYYENMNFRMFAKSSLPWTPFRCKIEFLPTHVFRSESKVELNRERHITEMCGSTASPKKRNIR